MIKQILNKPLSVLTIFILLSLIGIFMVFDLPVDLMPDMAPPYIIVQTIYPAAGPGEVEEDVTKKIEEQLINLEGLKNITSTSSEGASVVVLEFAWGQDTDKIELDVREKIDRMKHNLPGDAREPIIRKLDPNARPIVEIALQGEKDLFELNDIAENIIKPEMEQIRGIAKVDISGSRTRVVKVSVFQNRLEAYNLSVSQVSHALAVQNMTLGAGSLTEGKNEFLIRTTGKYNNIIQIESTIITSIPDNGTKHKILIRDIADVYFADEEETSRVLVNGSPGINIMAFKQTDANTVQAANEVIERLEDVKKVIPSNINIIVLRDSSKIITQSLNDVLSSAFVGILCSVIILLIFLRQIKSTLIVAISIPVSILITIIGMRLGGKTFNIVALAGLTLGVGMIVDASIVILENIFRHRQKGIRLQAASLFGTKEVVTPIIASILTSICVFLPILLFGEQLGVIGALMNDLAFVVIIALIASLLVAVFLVPVLTGHFLPIHIRQEKPIKNRTAKAIDGAIEWFLKKLESGYSAILKIALKNKVLTILTAVLLLIFSLIQIPKLGLNFLPPAPGESLILSAELPVGTSLDTTKELIDQLEAIARENLTGYVDIFQSAGQPDKSSGTLTLTLPDLRERTETPGGMQDILRNYFQDFPDVIFSFSSSGGLGGRKLLSGGADVSVKVKSDDFSNALIHAGEIKKIIDDHVPELMDVQLDAKGGLPEVEIVINREKTYDLGLNARDTAVEIRSQLSGTTATVLTRDNKTYDVVIRLRNEDRKNLMDLEKLFVINRAGTRVPVSSFAHLEKTTGPVSVQREDQVPTVTVTGSLTKGASANFTETKVREKISEFHSNDDDVKIEYGGEMEDIQESGNALLLILIFAALLVFGVMVSQFESLKAPFIVILSMPMLAIGVVGLYMILGQQFSMISLIGVIMLSGIVVNNGIVLVDYISLLRKRGEELFSACVKAGVSRLRPILMTTLTTILAMVPLAFFSGEGGSQMQPLAVTVVGGLSVNTIISLIFIPVLYFIFFRKGKEK